MRNLFFICSLLLAFITLNVPNSNAQTKGEEDFYATQQLYYFDELDYAFYKAYNAFLNGNDAIAAAKLRRAAYFVHEEANSAKVYNVKLIQKQADQIKSLADNIVLGKVNSSSKMRQIFANTHYVLAKDYKARTLEFWVKDKVKQTGFAMIATTAYLGHAAKWTGKEIEQGTNVPEEAMYTGLKMAGGGAATASVDSDKAFRWQGKKTAGKGAATASVESYRGIRWLGKKMTQGLTFIPTEVGQGLEWLDKGLEQVGEEIVH